MGEIILMNWKRYAKDLYNYDIITTFGNDFDIADAFGVDAIRDTYNRAFEEWKGNYKYLTELVLILNWKIWQYSGENDEYAELYDELWRRADTYALDTLKGDELNYFWDKTD